MLVGQNLKMCSLERMTRTSVNFDISFKTLVTTKYNLVNN